MRRAVDAVVEATRRWLGVSQRLAVFAGDRFLVSYPKSGNTWARFLVGNLMRPDLDVTFRNIEQIIPDIYLNGPAALRRVPRPRVLKSHERFDPRYRKVVYLVRDPRDVAVSYWHHHVKFRMVREDEMTGAFIDRFLGGQLDDYGSWATNVGSWVGGREADPDFLLVRYEDLLDRPETGLRRIAGHLLIEASSEELKIAIDRSSIRRMRRMEREAHADIEPLKSARTDLRFIRRGQAGAWVDELSPRFAERIREAWGVQMEQLGYLGEPSGPRGG